MTTELMPVGVTCNLSCPYCYEHPIRDAGNFGREYDIERMRAAIADVLEKRRRDIAAAERAGNTDYARRLKGRAAFSLFGGEALLLPLADLEEVFRWSFEASGSCSIQTNGSLITAAHIALFKRYRVNVGLSMDGPGELNDTRWAGSIEKTREMTNRSNSAIAFCRQAGVNVSLIVTLTTCNARPDRLPRLLQWLRDLDATGVASARIHMLERDNGIDNLALSADETIDALFALWRLELDLPRLRFDLFSDMLRMLRGDDGDATCIWKGCDPYTTDAVQGINGQGEAVNCGRTNKDGVDFVKAERHGYERQLALYHAPQESGGCAGCRFFVACKGCCPGEGELGDWRNRTTQCEVIMRLYTHFERLLVQVGQTPISRHPRRADVERMMLDAWADGRNLLIRDALARLRSSHEGSIGRNTPLPSHRDVAHGDGVIHRDSTADIPETYTPR